MRILHTADWQLGMNFSHAQARGETLRQARLDVVSAIVALARAEKVDAIVVAGDTFEDNRVDYRYIRDMAAALQRSPCPVYLLPGNHDPLTHDSPFEMQSGLFVPPLHVMRDAAPLPIMDGAATLFPCPAKARSWDGDPTAWIPLREASHGIRIGVAHGPQEGTPDECGYHIPSRAADMRELDYLALGHWHRVMNFGRAYYPGTPEPTRFGEKSGTVLLVDLPGPGRSPAVAERAIGQYDWQDLEVEVHGESDVAHVEAEMERLAGPSRLLRVQLSGTLPPSQIGLLEALEDKHAPRFFHLRFENRVVAVAEGTPQYRHPLLAAIGDRLLAAAAGPDEIEARAANRALSRLAALVHDSGSPDLR